MILGALHELRDLLLNLLETAIGTTIAGIDVELSFFDDFCTELLCGAPVGVGEKLIVCAWADDHQHVRPALPNEVLHQRIGEHCARRGGMQNIGAAIFFAKPVVGIAHVEDLNRLAFHGVGEFQKRIRPQIGNDEGIACSDFL